MLTGMFVYMFICILIWKLNFWYLFMYFIIDEIESLYMYLLRIFDAFEINIFRYDFSFVPILQNKKL